VIADDGERQQVAKLPLQVVRIEPLDDVLVHAPSSSSPSASLIW
jgi:hypothetical protein